MLRCFFKPTLGDSEGRIDDRLLFVVKDLMGSPNEGSGAYACWRRAFINYHESSSRHYYGKFLDSLDCLRPAFAVVIFGLNGIPHGWWTFNLDINSQDDNGQSLLYIAGLNGNLTAATELLDMGGHTLCYLSPHHVVSLVHNMPDPQ